MGEEIYTAVVVISVLTIIMGIMVPLIIINYKKKQEQLLHEKRAIEEEYRRQLMTTKIEIREETINFIGQELHDNIGQVLSSTKILMNMAGMQIKNVPDIFRTAEQSLAKAIQDLRNLSKSLNTEWLQQFNFIENIEAEKQRIISMGTIDIVINSDYEYLPLEADKQVILFRVIQEAIQNILKHANAKCITISINKTKDSCVLIIADDGQGFDLNSAKQKSLGLRNMEHRIKLLGGTILWKIGLERGAITEIVLPPI